MGVVRVVVVALVFAAMLPLAALAGTTGGITGRVVDSQSQAPLADVSITVTSPSQSATTTTDASGTYRFLSLAPDTYNVSFSKDGYDQLTQPGITILADQVQTLNMPLVKTLKTIARVTSRSAGNLLKPGTTSDVYSVNATTAQAAAGLNGPGGLSNAYGAIASVPGVSIDAGEQGWFQTVHIRGGDIDQVGYELDGIPVNRVYDNAPMTMLSSLGQQELQVYTGGTPASADAQGISGYINQVLKTGTYPGFGTGNLGIGTPAFYHHASVEAGGASPDRLFSYYLGIGASNQDYRFIDNNNGASQFNAFFYPMNLVDPVAFSPGCTTLAGTNNPTVYTGGLAGCPGTPGSPNAPLFASGIAYGIASTQQRGAVFNVHFGLPHKHSSLRDDIQLMYLSSEVNLGYYSSQNDLGPKLSNNLGTLSWDDSYIYNGPLMQAPISSKVSTYYFPSSPQHSFGAPLPAALRDTNDNGVGVSKFQYQHVFSPSAFLRAYAYTLYSNWYIDGPNTAAQPFYGAELAEYQIWDHTFGGNLSFVDQLSPQHLLTASIGYTGSNLQRYDIGFIRSHYNVASLIGNDGNCYDPSSGAQVGCVAQEQSDVGDIQKVLNNTLPPPSGLPPGSPGALQHARWLITNNYFYSGSGAALNQVHTRFLGYSVSDQWRPSDALNINLGLRVEDFRYLFGNTLSSDPARQFWFKHYNQEYCQTPGQAPIVNPNGLNKSCPAGMSSPGLVNPGNPGDYTVARFEPRLGMTYTVNPDTVLRASFGVYARPPNSSWVQYNVVQRDLPVYLGNHFAAFGFKSPEHLIRPDTSYNYDLSWEQRLKGTDWSFKVTPFYRATKDQLQNFFIDPQGGLESGLNVGSQQSVGVEVAIQKGDFTRNGFAGQLAYTYTHSRIKYQNFAGQNVNVIDQLNNYIKQYNGYTHAGGGSPCYFFESGGSAGPGTNNCSQAGVVANPYFGQTPQPLLDRNAYYPTYDVIPGPLAGTNGYWVPNVATLILNYKHDRFAITPSFTYSSGAEYGAPTSWPGYNPQSCYATLPGAGKAADPAQCDDLGGLPLFIPDKYTGKFDNLGQFSEPWRFSASLQLSYDVSSKVTAHVGLINIFDTCVQRGYAWDNSNICVYGALPSGVMAPAGNFYPNSIAASPPPQMRFPYSFWLNNANTGFVGTRVPMQVTFDLNFKL